MEELFAELEKVSGIPTRKNRVPLAALCFLGAASELWARLTRRPVLVSWATVQFLVRGAGRHQFDHDKSPGELETRFREIQETLRGEIEWFKETGLLLGGAKFEVQGFDSAGSE
jgi:dihydroflavonol-4-reductase